MKNKIMKLNLKGLIAIQMPFILVLFLLISTVSLTAQNKLFDSFDAIVNWGNGKAYIFKGEQYIRYDIKADKPDPGYPASIAAGFPGVFSSGIDAVVEWGNGKVYFFKGDKYIRYDIKADKADPGYPASIAAGFPGVFSSGIDAAVNWGNGKVYFFKGDQYIRYDIKADKADAGYPQKIAAGWPGVFSSGITAGINWGNGKAYLFKGGQYIRYDIKADKADAGYPASIAGSFVPAPVTTETGFRVIVNGIQCHKDADGGNSEDEPYIEVYVDGKKLTTWGPRAMNDNKTNDWEKIGQFFTPSSDHAKQTYWLMPGSVYAKNTVTIKLWEKDDGQGDSPFVNNDDFIGELTITKSTPDNDFIRKAIRSDEEGHWDIVCTKVTRGDFNPAVEGDSRLINVRVPVLAQGSSKKCVAYSIVGALTTVYLNKTKPGSSKEELFDPNVLYEFRSQSRRTPSSDDRTDCNNGDAGACRCVNTGDCGWEMKEALDAMLSKGLAFKNNPSKKLYLKSYYSYHKDGTIKIHTASNKSGVATPESGKEPNGYNNMRKVLKSGSPLICGYDVYPDFMAYAKVQAVYGGRISNTEKTGGHAVFVVGYTNPKLEAHDSPTWILQNSWNSTFGSNGLCRFAEGACNFDDVMYQIGEYVEEDAVAPTPTPTVQHNIVPNGKYKIVNTIAGPGNGASLSWDTKSPHPMVSVEHNDPVAWKFVPVAGKPNTYKIVNTIAGAWNGASISWDGASPHPMISLEHNDPVEWKMVPVAGKSNTYKIVNTIGGQWNGASISWDTASPHPMASLEHNDPVEWKLVPVN